MNFAKVLILGFFLLFSNVVHSQTKIPIQSIKGELVNKSNQQPIISATIQIINSDFSKGTKSNSKGKFKMDSIPVGRYSLKVNAIGFETIIQNIAVTSGKEIVLSLELQEKIFIY